MLHALAAFDRLVLNPFTILSLMLVIGSALGVRRPHAVGSILVQVATGSLFLLLVLPIDRWMARPLEDRFPVGRLPAHVDGILVLSGGGFPSVTTSRHSFSWGVAQLRLVSAAALYRRYPTARFIYSGGPGGGDEPGAAHVVFGMMGVEKNVVYESRSLNTWQNILYSKVLAHPRKGETWVLVTSALHMPRAMGVAAHLGWKMYPWPSDYLSPASGVWPQVEFGEQLSNLNKVLHEWIGLVVYRLLGRTDVLLPRPS